MSAQQTFLSGYVSGRYDAEQIDDFVDHWHSSTPDVSLREFLGFSEVEWFAWLRRDDALPEIAAARRRAA